MLVVPSVGQVAVLNSILSKSGGVTATLTLRLFSNDRAPAVTDTNLDYTEVGGPGYAGIVLLTANWNVVSANPSVALFNAFQTWTFTGTTNAPGTVYGYYITDSNNVLLIAERFPIVPFIPNNGSIIRVRPRLTCTYALS